MSHHFVSDRTEYADKVDRCAHPVGNGEACGMPERNVRAHGTSRVDERQAEHRRRTGEVDEE